MPDLLDPSHWLWLLLFCFGVYIAILTVRRVAEAVRPNLKANYWWNELVLPTMPVAFGLLFCIKYPFPMEVTGWSMRLILGAAGGYASGWSYRVVTAVIKRFTGVDVDAVLVTATEKTTTVTATKESTVAVLVPPPKDPPPLPPAVP